jgi:predicted DNA-binding helix-hairpin-helix protein
VNTRPPLLREHRLYQADWLLRHYGFKAGEILDERHQSFDPYIDPKCNWALNHREYFPVEINRAPYEKLLRVPGIGVKSAKRIVAARKDFLLSFESLKKLGVVLKRAQYFILCSGKIMDGLTVEKDSVIRALMSKNSLNRYYKDFTSGVKYEQLSFL